MPFFLLLSLPHQTHPQGRHHSIQVNLHIYYNQFLDALFSPLFRIGIWPSISSITSLVQASTHCSRSMQFSGWATKLSFLPYQTLQYQKLLQGKLHSRHELPTYVGINYLIRFPHLSRFIWTKILQIPMLIHINMFLFKFSFNFDI